VIHPRYVLKGAAALLALLLSAFAGPRGVVAGEDDRGLGSPRPAVVRALGVVSEAAPAAVVAHPVKVTAATRWLPGRPAVVKTVAARPCGAGGGPRAPC
jgi:hypothetical protein